MPTELLVVVKRKRERSNGKTFRILELMSS